MIYYIAHWDWILLQSRSEIVRSLSDKFQFVGITPLEKNKNQLNDYVEILNWKIQCLRAYIQTRKRQTPSDRIQ